MLLELDLCRKNPENFSKWINQRDRSTGRWLIEMSLPALLSNYLAFMLHEIIL